MTNFKKQAFAALTTIALLANVTGSAFAATTTLEVSGNGRNSTSDVTLNNNSTTSVVQNNVASVDNTIKVNSNTGGNKANDNSGDVMIRSGEATTLVGIDNSVNFNVAALDCGCLLGDVHSKIANNLRDSDNAITASLDDSKAVFQTNVSDLHNNADVDAKTGDNKANDNLGGIYVDPYLKSGDATSVFDVKNAGNENTYGTSFVMPGTGSHVELSWNWASMMAYFGMSM